MQRIYFLLACFFICSNCIAQQYPFVYYTPKDGLVNSRVRSIKQDSKGRMYFITYGGLSMYDGTRFINYRRENGLANELVNDIAEMASDSFLIATNTQAVNTLVKGKLNIFKTADNFSPLVNQFIKSSNGKWYVTSDNGLFVLEKNRFIKLPFADEKGNETGLNLDKIIEWKNYFFIIPWTSERTIFLYDRQSNKLLQVYRNANFFNIATDQQGRVWLSGPEGIKLMDTIALRNGLVKLLPLPEKYKKIDRPDALILFDKEDNIWLHGGNKLQKFTPDLEEQVFSAEQGLKTGGLVDIFHDREGIIWMATDGNGVIKLNGAHIQLFNNFSNSVGKITSIVQYNDTIWAFNGDNNTVHSVHKKNIRSYTLGGEKILAGNLLIHGKKLYLGDEKHIICISNKNDPDSYRNPQIFFTENKIIKSFGAAITDERGAIIQMANKKDSGFHLFVLKDGKQLMNYRLSYGIDQMSFDSEGRLWMATRDNHLLVFTLHPEQPEKYIQLQKDYFKQLPNISPRSITVDKNNNVWIGTRYDGLYRLSFSKNKLISHTQFTTKNGLTDNFIYNLHCDDNNNVWIGTQTGLDKIFLKDGQYIISNTSKTYNFFQSVVKITTQKNNTVWALTNEGNILKVSPASQPFPEMAPSLLLSLKINNKEYENTKNSFSYSDNNLSFHVAAPSFTDERSIRYSYLLEGSGNNNWSEASNVAGFNVINLAAGKYTFKVKSEFPEAMYPPQTLSYEFIIEPPYWQTWWFQVTIALLGIGVLAAIIRFYYRRKLEKKILLLENQQAIEKERTRIATDMHDDLGAGLSRIKFLSETMGIKKQQKLPIEEDIGKIREYSHQMIDKMGEIVWALNEKNDSLSDLLSYTRAYAMEYLSQNGIGCEVEMPDDFKGDFIRGEFRRNIFLSVKEILHNIVKHAEASLVHISIKTDKNIIVSIKDDGKGFDPFHVRPFSNGLSNIEKRMKDIKGRSEIKNEKGTMVKLIAPLPRQ